MTTTIYRLLGDPPARIIESQANNPAMVSCYGSVEKGGLCFSVREHEGQPMLCSSPGGWGVSFTMPPDQIERYQFGDPKHGDFGALLRYYLAGKAVLPNFEPVPIPDGMNSIAAGAGMAEADGGVQHILLPGADRTCWARAFISFTQGGRFDGSGYVIWYRTKNWNVPWDGESQIARFAICKHEKRDGPGANHMRGWHPGSCTKCGLDLTVDSSD